MTHQIQIHTSQMATKCCERCDGCNLYKCGQVCRFCADTHREYSHTIMYVAAIPRLPGNRKLDELWERFYALPSFFAKSVPYNVCKECDGDAADAILADRDAYYETDEFKKLWKEHMSNTILKKLEEDSKNAEREVDDAEQKFYAARRKLQKCKADIAIFKTKKQNGSMVTYSDV